MNFNIFKKKDNQAMNQPMPNGQVPNQPMMNGQVPNQPMMNGQVPNQPMMNNQMQMQPNPAQSVQPTVVNINAETSYQHSANQAMSYNAANIAQQTGVTLNSSGFNRAENQNVSYNAANIAQQTGVNLGAASGYNKTEHQNLSYNPASIAQQTGVSLTSNTSFDKNAAATPKPFNPTINNISMDTVQLNPSAPKPQPIPMPTPAPAPAPVAPKPQPVPQPMPTPAPAPTPVAPKPQPVPQPMPTPAPAPTPVAPKPQPVPQPMPTPTPAPTPVAPKPQPVPQPMPTPAPAPTPVAPKPQPVPQSMPTPAPAPTPVAPKPQPMPTPAPAPTPAPTPVAPTPAPAPVAPTPAPAPVAPTPAPQASKPSNVKRTRAESCGNVLVKGQKWAVLGKDGKFPVKLKIGVGWETIYDDCDVDSSAFMLAKNDKVPDESCFIFYGQDKSEDNSVSFRSNAGNMQLPDDAEILIDTSLVRPDVDKITICLTIYESFERNLNFSMVKNIYVRIMDENGNEIARYVEDLLSPDVTSLVVGELYRYKDSWKFYSIGSGYHKNLEDFCSLYGIDVTK